MSPNLIGVIVAKNTALPTLSSIGLCTIASIQLIDALVYLASILLISQNTQSQLMNNPCYTSPSHLGSPIIKLFGFVPSGECIETIESLESSYGWGFSDCQVLKYLWRLGVKTEDIKGDCHKILDYIDRAIANESHITETLKIVELHVICLMKRHGIDELS